MSAILGTRPRLTRPARGAEEDRTARGPAARAAARVSLAGLVLGGLGLASALFVIVRLIESWRVTPRASSHHISVLGAQLTYPVANGGAIVVLVLALLGLAVTVTAVLAAGGEMVGSIRLSRRLRAIATETLDGALVVEDEEPRAFCAGLLRPRVYVTTGALTILDPPALAAVLMHEREHVRRRDPLRFAAGRVMSAALFFLPTLNRLLSRQHALAELGADERAAGQAGSSRSALARAMLAFAEHGYPDTAVGVDPERVDHLLGESIRWRFPLFLSAVTAAAIGLLVAVAGLAGHVARGSATLAPPFLSSRPCVVMLAGIPAVLSVIACYLALRRARQ